MEAHFTEIIMSVLGTIFTAFLANASRELSLMRKSVEQLNIRMAVIVERVEHHEMRLLKLERKVIYDGIYL